MKKLLLSVFSLIGILASVNAQTTWNYNFGTGATATIADPTAPATQIVKTAPDFIPSAQTNGGSSVTARVGSQGGSITLSNTSNTNASLVFVAPTGNSANKFAISGYTPENVATTKFTVKFGTATNGTFNFIQGKFGAGATNSYTSGSQAQDDDTFTGVRFVMATGGMINVGYRLNNAWSALTGVTLVQGNTYEIEVYMNNSSSDKGYNRSGPQTIASGKVDIWIDGVLRGNDLSSGGLLLNAKMDSFAFYADMSNSNALSITLDDIAYANFIVPTVLPVSLTSFTGKANGQAIDLAWATVSEKDNSHFDILRSGDGKTFSKIGEVKGNGTTDISKNYAFADKNALPGVNYYQLRQVDFNGNPTLSKVEAIRSNVTASSFKITPNQTKQTIEVTIYAATADKGTLKIYDLNGRKIYSKSLSLEKGHNTLSVPALNSSGLHVANLAIGTENITSKFVK